MWSDGHFNPHRWDYLGFNEYELKHCCFGEDSQEDATGGDIGDADDFYESDALPTPDDFSGLQEAYEDTVVGGNKGFGRSGPMTDEEVQTAVGQAGGTQARSDPYSDMIARGIIQDPLLIDIGDRAPKSPGLTPEELGFAPQFGYGSYIDPVMSQQQGYSVYSPYNPRSVSDTQLDKSFEQAMMGSRDIGSDIASLFGFQSPVELDPEKGFYEGTTFDPFDAPVLQLGLSAINPALGALYGLGKGVAKGDPIGGALGMIGPFSPLAPVVRAGLAGLGAYNVLSGQDKTATDMLGFDIPFVDIPGLPDRNNPLNTSIDLSDYYTSTSNKADPYDNLKGTVQGRLSDFLDKINPFAYDPRSGAPSVNSNLNLDTTMSGGTPLSSLSLDGTGSPEKEISGMYGNWQEPKPMSPELGLSSVEQDAINHVRNDAVMDNVSNALGHLSHVNVGAPKASSIVPVTTEPIEMVIR